MSVGSGWDMMMVGRRHALQQSGGTPAKDRAHATATGISRAWRRLFFALVCLSCLANAFASANAIEFRRKQWTIDSGAPADIWALAQGESGYLWLGTGNGLYRFDGVRFERFEPRPDEAFPSNDITALKMMPDGSLWIGFYYGGASIKRGDQLSHYAPGRAFPSGVVYSFAQTRDGSLWAAAEGGLARFDGKQWHTVGTDWNYPAAHADWVLAARDGTLWVTTGETLLFLRPGAMRFEATDQAVYRNSIIAQAPDGTLWLSDHDRGTRALPGLDADHPHIGQPKAVSDDYGWSHRLLFDRYGNLWGTGVDNGGIYRVADQARLAQGRSLERDDITEVIDRHSGLMTNRAVPLLEDAEGTVWAGTNMGLVSFHRNDVKVPADVPLGNASNYAMAVDGQGVPWIVNNGTLWRIDPRGAAEVRGDLHDIGSALFDHDDRLWMIGRHGLYRLHGEAMESVPLPAGINATSAFTIDRAGAPWVAFAGHGLYRLEGDRFIPQSPVPALKDLTPTSLAVDGAGHLWLGYPDNLLVDFDGGHARLYTSSEGLHVGHITVIKPLGDEVLVGGELGLARLRGGRVQSIVIADNDVFSGISGIVKTPDGDLWLNAGKGVVRLPGREAETAFTQPGYRPSYRLFDYDDGLPGIALQAAIAPTALTDAGGNLWFLTNQGPAWIRPDDLLLNALAPPVDILGLTADGTRHAPSRGLRLPKGTDNVQIRYTAASLAIPERVRFRYKLEGVDASWQEAGARREAFYANLGPGTYRFRVIAANDDGVWNTQGAELTFSIAPWFYQTAWFAAACALALLAAVAVFFAWRTRLAAERVHLQLSERMDERERIARDIHDTLLQGIQGLLLRLQALVSGMKPDDRHAEALKDAIEQARDMVIEGRGKIVSLRGDSPEYTEMVQSLLAVGENLASLYQTAFHIRSEGRARPILPSAFDEILDIVREGIRNAFLHAQATRIDVLVAYEQRQLRIVVTDDGSGIDEQALRDAGRNGHWGVIGMHERARKLGAGLALKRRTPHGTELTLTVPCRVAFRDEPPDSTARRRRAVS
jgi:signal transduction histidine kinase/ligand-binding sensor domain-containing protein